MIYPTKMDVSPEMRTITPKRTQAGETRVVPNKPAQTPPVLKGNGQVPELLSGDSRVQLAPGAPNTPAPIRTSRAWERRSTLPPDTTGDVGPNHYVQWTNVDYAVYSKTGTLMYGPAAGNTLWSGFGGGCAEQQRR